MTEPDALFQWPTIDPAGRAYTVRLAKDYAHVRHSIT